jgi:ATP-dependent DNA ligase
MKQAWEKESPQVARLNEYKQETSARSLTFDEVLDFLQNKDYIASVKIDGEETLLQISGGVPKLYSRAGRVRTDFPVTEEIKQLGTEDLIAIGELHVVDDQGLPIPYPDAVSTLRVPTPETENRIRLAIFDILATDNVVLEDMPYETRVQSIREKFGKGKFVHPAIFAINEPDAVKRLWDEMVQGKGYEGLVITYEEDGEEKEDDDENFDYYEDDEKNSSRRLSGSCYSKSLSNV